MICLESLDVCKRGKSYGSKELIIAFDEFFRQYRTDKNTERNLTLIWMNMLINKSCQRFCS